MKPISRPSDRLYTSPRKPPSAAARGASPPACSPTCASWSFPGPSSPTFFESGDPRWTSQTVATM